LTQQNKTEKKPFFYGYVIVGLSSLVNVLLGGSLYTFSVFFEPLSGEFGWTRALTSGAFSLYMFLHGFLYILTGRLNDRYGPRIVLSGCGLFMGIGYMLMSLVSEVWHVYLFYGVVIAVGMSGGYVPITSTVTRWFESDSRRGLMIGISIAGTGLGTMIMPPIANWLISSYGWQTSYVIIGIMVLVLIMAAAQFMRRAPESAVQTGADGKAILKKGLTIGQAMRTRQFWLLSISYF
jgi:MFS family permease